MEMEIEKPYALYQQAMLKSQKPQGSDFRGLGILAKFQSFTGWL
jgi:hypothetical protein